MLTAEMNKNVKYLDKDARIVFRFLFQAIGYAHVLERRKRWWIFEWWTVRAWMYDDIISGKTRFGELVSWLLWKESTDYNSFDGYPK